MSEINPQEFGHLQAQVAQLEKAVDGLRSDVKELLAAVENARGGWRTILLLGGVAGTLGALAMKVATVFQIAPVK